MDKLVKQNSAVAMPTNTPMGFDDDDASDIIIPRIKVIQSLSPERKEKAAEEGDIINSLTKEKLNGKSFVPVFKFNSNISWIDRNDGGGIACQARDGKLATNSAGEEILCAACKKNLFDNTKQGRDAMPTCTKYMNFFGFFEGESVPIILSFAKTNYNEGKKLYSLAKVSMQNIWNHSYKLVEKLVKKNSNEWYIIDVIPNGPTDEVDRAFAMTLFKNFKGAALLYDEEYNQVAEETIVKDASFGEDAAF